MIGHGIAAGRKYPQSTMYSTVLYETVHALVGNRTFLFGDVLGCWAPFRLAVW